VSKLGFEKSDYTVFFLHERKIRGKVVVNGE
jgi:hypothetical protein